MPSQTIPMLQRTSANRGQQRTFDALAHELAHAPGDALGMQIVLRAEHVLCTVMHVLVGNADAMEKDISDPQLLRAFHDRRSESARKRAFFDGDDPRAGP